MNNIATTKHRCSNKQIERLLHNVRGNGIDALILHHIVQVRLSQKPERSGRALPVGIFDVEVIAIVLRGSYRNNSLLAARVRN